MTAISPPTRSNPIVSGREALLQDDVGEGNAHLDGSGPVLEGGPGASPDVSFQRRFLALNRHLVSTNVVSPSS
jgi:hypothetical protein